MQFIPSTWRIVGSDLDGDGVKNPQDINDAAAATAIYLCAGPGNLADPADAYAAVRRYNNSDSYARTVLAIAQAYREGKTMLPLADLPAGSGNGSSAAASEPEAERRPRSTRRRAAGPVPPARRRRRVRPRVRPGRGRGRTQPRVRRSPRSCPRSGVACPRPCPARCRRWSARSRTIGSGLGLPPAAAARLPDADFLSGRR